MERNCGRRPPRGCGQAAAPSSLAAGFLLLLAAAGSLSVAQAAGSSYGASPLADQVRQPVAQALTGILASGALSAEPAPTQASPAELELVSEAQPAPTPAAQNSRQTRATSTTRKLRASSADSDEPATTTPSPRLAASSQAPDEDDSDLSRGRATRGRRKKAKAGARRTLDKDDDELDDDFDDDDLDLEMERAKRRRNKNRRLKASSTATAGASTPVPASAPANDTSKLPESSSTQGSVVGSAPSTSSAPHTANTTHPLAVKEKKRVSPTSGSSLEYYDDYEEDPPQRSSPKQSGQAKVEKPKSSLHTNTTATSETSAVSLSTNVTDASASVDNSTNVDLLDPRSPSGSLGKRISGMLAGDYKKRSTTQKPNQATKTGEAQNQTKPAANSSLEALDWSKLVKVVFKSAKDNETLYTVVMNSSELSQHPINDWSNEMPQLLQRDLEKLIKKWSNVFPKDILVSDLGRMIVNHSFGSQEASIAPSLFSKLNETFSLLGNMSSVSIQIPLSYSNGSKWVDLNGTRLESGGSSPVYDGMASFTTVSSVNGIASTLTSSPENHPQISVSHLNSTTKLVPGTSDDASSAAYLLRNSTNLNMSSPKFLNLSLAQAQPNESSQTQATLANASGNKPWNIAPASGPEVGNNQLQMSAGKSKATESPFGHLRDSSFVANKSLVDFMKDVNEEHAKMQDSVKEQTNSLRHFIMISSIGVVVATSLVVALIVVLNK